MRVAFTGSRHWKDREAVRAALIELSNMYDDLEVCHGDAGHGDEKRGGVDAMVRNLAEELGISQTPFPVNSALDGNHRGAPLNRNKRMLEAFNPDMLVAFRADGKSNGTDNTIGHAENMMIKVVVFKEKP